MDAVGLDRQCDIGAGVDQESGSQFSVLSFQLCDDADGFSGQQFQIARGKIFFAELDVVDAGAGGFADFFQKTATARRFVPGEGGAVGDVVEKAAFRPSALQFNAAGWLLELRALSAQKPLIAPAKADYFSLASTRLLRWTIRYGLVFAISGRASPSFLGVPPRWYFVRPSRRNSKASSGLSTILNWLRSSGRWCRRRRRPGS